MWLTESSTATNSSVHDSTVYSKCVCSATVEGSRVRRIYCKNVCVFVSKAFSFPHLRGLLLTWRPQCGPRWWGMAGNCRLLTLRQIAWRWVSTVGSVRKCSIRVPEVEEMGRRWWGWKSHIVRICSSILELEWLSTKALLLIHTHLEVYTVKVVWFDFDGKVSVMGMKSPTHECHENKVLLRPLVAFEYALGLRMQYAIIQSSVCDTLDICFAVVSKSFNTAMENYSITG